MTKRDFDATIRQLRNPRRMTLDEALVCENPVFEIVNRVPAPLAAATPAERTLWQVNCFLADVDNGGLAQALANDTGELAPVVMAFAREHGPAGLMRVMEELSEMFPGGAIPPDRDDRASVLASRPEAALSELTDRIYGLRAEIEAALLRFILEHRDQFPMELERPGAARPGEAP